MERFLIAAINSSTAFSFEISLRFKARPISISSRINRAKL
jgi:hypothetical protein